MNAKHPDYPAMKWHPETGEPTVFNAPGDVPAGYLDRHPNDPAGKVEVKKPDAPAKVPALCLTRKEIRAELDAGGIAYEKDEPTAVLYDKLVAALKAHLEAAEVEFDEAADAKALLALVPKPE